MYRYFDFPFFGRIVKFVAISPFRTYETTEYDTLPQKAHFLIFGKFWCPSYFYSGFSSWPPWPPFQRTYLFETWKASLNAAVNTMLKGQVNPEKHFLTLFHHLPEWWVITIGFIPPPPSYIFNELRSRLRKSNGSCFSLASSLVPSAA